MMGFIDDSSAATWTATATEINSLPQAVRAYIHGLVSNCDPSGMVRENTMLRDIIRELSASNASLRKQVVRTNLFVGRTNFYPLKISQR